MDNLNVEIGNMIEDGRWDDSVWVNNQAEISACEDLLERMGN